jgi:hypothetical protein
MQIHEMAEIHTVVRCLWFGYTDLCLTLSAWYLIPCQFHLLSWHLPHYITETSYLNLYLSPPQQNNSRCENVKACHCVGDMGIWTLRRS